MIRYLRSCSSLGVVMTILLAVAGPVLRAQTTMRERWDQVTLGNNDLGIDAIAWARTRNNLGAERRVDTMLLTQARLFGNSVELQRIAATAVRNGSSFAGSTSLRRAGLTVRNDAVTNTGTVSYWNSANVFGNNPHQTFWIYFIPITVGANLGHIGAMDVTLLNMASNGAMISGAMSTYAWGFASFAVGPVRRAVRHAGRHPGRRATHGRCARRVHQLPEHGLPELLHDAVAPVATGVL
jgi:hypothetical protein